MLLSDLRRCIRKAVECYSKIWERERNGQRQAVSGVWWEREDRIRGHPPPHHGLQTANRISEMVGWWKVECGVERKGGLGGEGGGTRLSSRVMNSR